MRKLFITWVLAIASLLVYGQDKIVFSIQKSEIQKTVVNSKIYLIKVEGCAPSFIENFSNSLLKIQGVLRSEVSAIGATGSANYYLNVEIRRGQLDKDAVKQLFDKYNIKDCKVDGEVMLISDVIK